MPNADPHCRPVIFQHTVQTLMLIAIQIHIASRLAALTVQEKDLGRFHIQLKPLPIQEQHRQTFAAITDLNQSNPKKYGWADGDSHRIMY
jgi:hypothetical protein